MCHRYEKMSKRVTQLQLLFPTLLASGPSMSNLVTVTLSLVRMGKNKKQLWIDNNNIISKLD